MRVGVGVGGRRCGRENLGHGESGGLHNEVVDRDLRQHTKHITEWELNAG